MQKRTLPVILLIFLAALFSLALSSFSQANRFVVNHAISANDMSLIATGTPPQNSTTSIALTPTKIVRSVKLFPGTYLGVFTFETFALKQTGPAGFVDLYALIWKADGYLKITVLNSGAGNATLEFSQFNGHNTDFSEDTTQGGAFHCTSMLYSEANMSTSPPGTSFNPQDGVINIPIAVNQINFTSAKQTVTGPPAVCKAGLNFDQITTQLRTSGTTGLFDRLVLNLDNATANWIGGEANNCSVYPYVTFTSIPNSPIEYSQTCQWKAYLLPNKPGGWIK